MPGRLRQACGTKLPVLAALETPRGVVLGTWVSFKVKSQVFQGFTGNYRVK